MMHPERMMNRFLVLLAALSPVPAIAAAPQPAEHEAQVAGLVAMMLERYHYDTHAIDDQVSERWFDGFLEQLDYGRLYFLQSDIDELQALRQQLDDEVRADPPRLDTAGRIYERYQQRVHERVDSAMTLLEGGLDVSDQESWIPDRADADLAWPATADEATELWRQRLEEEIILGRLSGETDDDVTERLRKRYERYAKAIDDWESVDILEMWLSGLARAYDPHSAWFKPATNDNFDIEITNSVEGIGASLRTEGDYTIVVELIAGGPAARDGQLRPNDKIVAVAQGKDDPVDVVGQRIDKVVKLIRGSKGSEVRLTVRHEDAPELDVIEITRDRVMLEESDAEKSVHDVGDRTFGVVTLPRFYVDPNSRRSGKRATTDVKRLLRELDSEGVDGVVFDLRRNGGGSLTESVDVAGLFIPGGPVVQIRDRHGAVEAMRDTDPGVAWDGPLVVLTDPTSASASEIVAGAIQDYGRGVIVGAQTTHGKGTVQQVAPLSPQLNTRSSEDVGGALKLTVQKFYRVSGGSTQHKGVESDVVLPSYWDGLDVHESDLDNALPWDQIPPIPHARSGDLSSTLPELRTLSAARVRDSDDFSKLSRLLEEREQLDSTDTVSLNFETRKAEHEARQARTGIEGPSGTDAAEPADGEQDAEAEEDDDFVLDEALQVLNDLVDLTV